MKREYTLIIEAKWVDQPTIDEIFQAVRKLVETRLQEYPKLESSTSVTLTPKGT